MNHDMTRPLFNIDELTAVLTAGMQEPASRHLTDDEFVEYASGDVQTADEDAIDAHLSVCSSCSRRLEHLTSESECWTSKQGRRRVANLRRATLNQLKCKLANSESLNTLNRHDENAAFRPKPPLRLRTPGELDILEVLDELNVIERQYDYVLPSGLHSDTYINTAKLCHTEDGIQFIAKSFDFRLRHLEFNVIVCNSWAMGVIARRLAYERELRVGVLVKVVVSEGYISPTFVEDLPQRARVLVMVDVCVTGSLIHRLTAEVYRHTATIVGITSLIKPARFVAGSFKEVIALGTIEMALVDPRLEPCSRCNVMRKLVFNPISSCMTVKKLVPRSPTEFLAEFPDAEAFWEIVNESQAYEHHRVENNTHFVAFVDTAKMLSHAQIGPKLVEAFCELLIKGRYRPNVILVPHRNRARMLAARVAKLLNTLEPSSPIEVISTKKRGNRWILPAGAYDRLRQATVLIVDTASGHGCVLDELMVLLQSVRARFIAAGVILSRLPEACEDALRHRLNGRFYRLYHLPIRPVAIRSSDRALCPVCNERALLKQAAIEENVDAIEELARQNLSTSRYPRKQEISFLGNAKAYQLELFDTVDRPLLHRCRRGIASGITLHALNAAMTDGMAPLALPELKNKEIPVTNRVAMVENLPPNALNWSEEFLVQSIEDFLTEGTDEPVWAASAEILARDGRAYWVAYLHDLLGRSEALMRKPNDKFWNRLTYGVHRIAAHDADVRAEVKTIATELLDEYRQSSAADGLQRMLSVLRDEDRPTAGVIDSDLRDVQH